MHNPSLKSNHFAVGWANHEPHFGRSCAVSHGTNAAIAEHEEAEAGHAGDDAAEHFTDVILHWPRTGEPYHRDPRGVAERAEAYLASTGIAGVAMVRAFIEAPSATELAQQIIADFSAGQQMSGAAS